MDYLERFLINSKLSTLERYKSKYEELVNFSQTERDEIEISIKNEIDRIEKIPFTDDIKDAVKECLAWKFMAAYYLPKQIESFDWVGHSKLSYDLEDFLKITKQDIFEYFHWRQDEIGRAHV